MTMKIITTVGTSIFKNWGGNTSEFDYPFTKADWEGIKNDPIVKTVSDWAKQKGKTASAEIASIIEIKEELEKQGINQIEVHLICTETTLSRLAAECIEKWFKEKDGFVMKTIVVVENLQVKDKVKFEQKGVIALIDSISKIAQNGIFWDDLYFNITGGYKATIPILTVIGQIKKRPIKYIFEESDNSQYQLIGLPQLPLSIDWQMLFSYSKYFIELNEGIIGTSWKDYKEKNNLPDEFDNYYQEVVESNDYLLGLNGVGYFLSKELENHFFINTPISSPLFAEDFTKKRQVEFAIKELHRKLIHLSVPFGSLIDPFIKHDNFENTTIYKHTQPQIRIHYKWDEKLKSLTIFNHRFINSDIDDKDPKRGYKPIFVNLYPALKEQNQIIIGFEKY